MTKQRQTFGDRMAVLKNARHERFAQAIAEGKTQEEAYKHAGYKPNASNASTLNRNQQVRDRVATIQAAGAAHAEITVASVTENLARIAKKAEELEDSPGLSVARLAHMDIAKLAGLVTDKVQTETTKPLAPRRTPEQALAALKTLAAEQGVSIN
jgi:hypothetical protein